MAVTLSQAQYDKLFQVASLYFLGTAPENQLHVDAVEQIADVIVEIGAPDQSGKTVDKVTAMNIIRDHPIISLVMLAAFIGKP